MVRKRILNLFINDFVNDDLVIRDFVDAWKKIERQRIQIELDDTMTQEDKNIMLKAVVRNKAMYEREIRNRIVDPFFVFLTKMVFAKAENEILKEGY